MQRSKLKRFRIRSAVRYAGGLFLVLALSGIARAQINPQYQLSTAPLAGFDVNAPAPNFAVAEDEVIVAQPTLQSQTPQAAPAAPAQPAPAQGIDVSPYRNQSEMYYHEWSWESGVYAGGGTGIGSSQTTQFFLFGLHVGKVLTGTHFPGVLRGNFEFGGEFMPMYEVFTVNNTNVYGVSIKPVILRWNLVHWNKFTPFMQLAGGFLITNQELPPGNTSAFNFTPQGGFGFNVFTKPGEAVKTEFIFGHISNANLGIRNPGINSLFLFEIGYEWLHGWRHH
ncbi:MAG: acyloxyacyl hydrolase [Candidatus Acidiferrales bacterium]